MLKKGSVVVCQLWTSCVWAQHGVARIETEPFSCKLDLQWHTQCTSWMLNVRFIYSSNQSHVEAVLADRLAYFLTLRNVSSLFVLFCSPVLFIFLSALLPLSLSRLFYIYRPDVEDWRSLCLDRLKCKQEQRTSVLILVLEHCWSLCASGLLCTEPTT